MTAHFPTGAFYADWKLLDATNQYDPYVPEPLAAATETYAAEPVLEAAYRLLSLNRPLYIVRLYGGEPSIHPCLPDLWRYLLSSGRDVRIILHTNGLRSRSYYEPLFQLGGSHVHLSLNVCSWHIDQERLFSLIACAHAAGLSCEVVLNYAEEYSIHAGELATALAALRRTRPFGFKLYSHRGEAPIWLDKILNIFSAQDAGDTVPGWAKTCSARPEGRFFCHGVNVGHVCPDGRMTLGLARADLPFAPHIGEEGDLLPGMPQAPAFSSRREAELWLKKEETRNLKYFLDRWPVRHPLQKGLSAGQKLHARFASVAAWRAAGITGDPRILHERQQDILKILDFLADAESCDLFLALVKAAAIGDCAQLADQTQASADQTSFQRIVFEDDAEELPGAKSAAQADPSCAREDSARQYAVLAPAQISAVMRAGADKDASAPSQTKECGAHALRNDAQYFASEAEFDQKLPIIKWYGISFEILLHLESPWLDQLLAIQSQLPEYKFSLRADNNRIRLHAEAPLTAARKRAMAAQSDRSSLSILIHASGTIPVFNKTVESAQAFAGVDYEIIIICDSAAPWLGIIADQLARNQPWNTRAFHFEEKLDLGTAWNEGLALASGKYLYFLRCGETLDGESLACGIMESNDADICIFSPQFQEMALLNVEDIRDRLAWNMDTDGICQGGKLYRRRFALEHGLAFGVCYRRGDAVFNLCAFLLARTIALFPGQIYFTAEQAALMEPDPAVAIAECHVIFRQLAMAGKFLRAHPLAGQAQLEQKWLRRFLGQNWRIVSSGLAAAFKTDRLDEMLAADVLVDLAAHPALTLVLGRRLGAIAPHRRALPVTKASAPHVPCYEICGKMAQAGQKWKLAIITSLHEAELAGWLPAGNCHDVEHILVVHGATGKPSPRLAMLLDMYPNISAIGIAADRGMGAGRNMALALAHADAVTFCLGADSIEPDFIAQAANAIDVWTEDIFIYEWRKESATGAMEQHSCGSASFAGERAMGEMLAAGMEPGMAAVVLRKDHLLEYNIKFDPAADYDVNAPLFLAQAARQARVRFMPFPALRRRTATTSPEACAEDLQDLCQLFVILDRYSVAWPEQNREAWTNWLERCVIDKWLPLRRLAPDTTAPQSPQFLAALIKEYARHLARTELAPQRGITYVS